MRDKAGSTLTAFLDLENILTLLLSGCGFILHLAHHLASLSRSFSKYSADKSVLSLTVHWLA